MDSGYARRFSVIIPTYNYGHSLPRAIESVLVQSGDDYELIVVDDGSTDMTADIVRRYQNDSEAVRYVYQDNRGPATARNHGVAVSGGQYLLFLDADDALLHSALSTFRRAANPPCKVDFVLARWRQVSSKGRIKEVEGMPLSPETEEMFFSYMRGPSSPVAPGSAVFHRRIFDRLNFPEALRSTEDRVFYAQVFALYSGLSIADVVVTVHRHRSSLSHNLELAKQNGPKAIELIFDPLVLPKRFMACRGECTAMMHRSLFHRCCEGMEYREALDHFYEVVKISPRYVWGWRHIRRYLRAQLGLLREPLLFTRTQPPK